jgi:hypothetical protein
MHRSGTSLMSALLCAAGLDGPKTLLPANEYNETGYWESEPLKRFHDRMLEEMGVGWDTPLTYPGGILSSPGANAWQAQLLEILLGEYDDSPFLCLKDPRISRLLPLWMPLLMRAGIEASYVIVTRNPLEVAQSLKRRDGFHWSKSMMLWLRHTLEAEKETRGEPRVFVTYDQLLGNWRDVLRRLAEHLHIVWPRRASEIDIDFEGIVADRLRHHRAASGSIEARGDIVSWVADAYRACLAAAEDQEDAQVPVFDRLREALEAADRAFEPLLMIEEARYRDLEKSKAAVSEHEALARSEIEALRNELAARLNELGGVQAAAAAMRDDAAEIARRLHEVEAESASSALAETAQAEAAELRTRIEELNHEHTALQAALTARDGELAEVGARAEDLRSTLVAVAAESAQREATVAGMSAESADLHTKLAAASARADLFQAEAGDLGTRIEELRAGHDASVARLNAREAEMADARREAAAARVELTSALARLESLQGEMTGLGTRVSGLIAELTAAQTELVERSAELAAVQAAKRQDQRTLALRTAEVSETRKAFSIQEEALKREAQAAAAELEARASALRELRTALHAAEARAIAFSVKLAQLRAELAIGAEENADLRSQLPEPQHSI